LVCTRRRSRLLPSLRDLSHNHPTEISNSARLDKCGCRRGAPSSLSAIDDPEAGGWHRHRVPTFAILRLDVPLQSGGYLSRQKSLVCPKCAPSPLTHVWCAREAAAWESVGTAITVRWSVVRTQIPPMGNQYTSSSLVPRIRSNDFGMRGLGAQIQRCPHVRAATIIKRRSRHRVRPPLMPLAQQS
jgi:hypothetical protein